MAPKVGTSMKGNTGTILFNLCNTWENMVMQKYLWDVQLLDWG